MSLTEAVKRLPPLRDVITHHGLTPLKKLGQNFLFDLNLTQRIARSAGTLSDVTVVEIGPGPGGLTRALFLEGAQRVIAIERDERAIQALHALQEVVGTHLDLRQEDALTFDYEKSSGPLKIVANLPYNISTMLLIQWLRQAHLFESMTLMFQKEVAERLLAPVSTSAYGRLSVMTQWRTKVRRCFDIPPQAFIPAPKVTSTVVHLEPFPCDQLNGSFEALEHVTKIAFMKRRKMIRSSLKPLWGEQTLSRLQALDIDPTHRAENLTISDFLKLAQEFHPII